MTLRFLLLNDFKAVLPSPAIPTSQCIQDISSHFSLNLSLPLSSDFVTYNYTIYVMGFTHNSLSALWIYNNQPSNVLGSLSFTPLFFLSPFRSLFVSDLSL